MSHSTLHVLLISADPSGLPSTGLEFHPLTNLSDLRQRLNGPPPDVVLADADRLDAFTLLKLTVERWPATPVAVLLAPGQTDQSLALIEAGVREVIFKTPSDLALLPFRLAAGLTRMHTSQTRTREAYAAARERLAARLRVLNAIGAAVQEAHTPAEVFEMVGRELTHLHLDFHITQLTPDGARLMNVHSSMPATVMSTVRTIFGLTDSEEAIALSLAQAPLFRRVLETRETIFTQDILSLYIEALAGDRVRAAALIASYPATEAILAPLMRRGALYGVLIVTGHEQLTEDDALAVTAFANQIGIALANTALMTEATRRAERLRVVNDVGRVLSATLDLHELYALIHQEAARVLPADAFYVALYDEATQTIHLPYLYDHGTALPPETIPYGTGLTSSAIRTRQPIITRNADDIRTQSTHRTGDPRRPSISGLHMPMLASARVVGVLSAQTSLVDAYTEDDIQLLGIIASQSAVAIENARLYEETRRRAEEVSALLDVAQSISATLDTGKSLHRIAQSAKTLVDAEGCSVYLLDVERGDLHALVALEDYADEVLAMPIRVGQGVTGHIAQTGVGELINHVEKDPRGVQVPGTPHQSECMIAVPLLVEGRITGVMTVTRRGSREFGTDDLRLLTSFASQAAVAIENARLFDETRRRAEEVTALLTTTEAIASTLDLDTLLKIVGHQALRLSDADGCTLWRYEPARALLLPLLVLEPGGRRLAPLLVHPGANLLTEVALSGIGKIANPVEADELTPGECLMGVPLRVREEVLGVMSVRRFGTRTFKEDDLQLLSSFAHQAAVAMENARLYDAARRQAHELGALYDIGLTLGKTLDLATLLEQALELVLDVTSQTFALLYLYHEEDDTLRVAAACGTAPHAAPGLVLAPGARQASQAVQQARTLVGRFGTDDAWTMVSVPLISKGQVLGVLEVGQTGPQAPSNELVRLLKTIAQEITGAIENARLYNALKERAQTLQRAYDELAEADRLKDELVQNVSHELRTPLIFIKGYVDLLLLGELGALSLEQQDALRIVESKTDTLTRLVNNIMTLQTSNNGALQLAQLDLNELAQRALQGAEIPAAQQGLTLHSTFPTEPLTVLGDRERLYQVFDNLLGNAIKFTPRGGSVGLRVWHEGDYVYAEITDTGIGIAPEKLPRIFERFYQVDGSTTRRYGGAGLGLTISKQIIELHGGQLHVASTLGAGSRFWFALRHTH